MEITWNESFAFVSYYIIVLKQLIDVQLYERIGTLLEMNIPAKIFLGIIWVYYGSFVSGRFQVVLDWKSLHN